MKLIELQPRYFVAEGSRPSRIVFQCPRCGLGVVSVWIKEGEQDSERGIHGCNRVPPDFDTITITPSIADEGKCRRCPGWHGHIENGEVKYPAALNTPSQEGEKR